MLVFDGHLDIAYNALSHERDPRWTVAETRTREADPPCDDGRDSCTTSLPEMRAAGVAVAATTLLGRCKPWVKPGRPGAAGDGDWPSPEMVHGLARGQLAYYRRLERAGEVRVIETAGQLDAHWAEWQRADAATRERLPVGLIVVMECADPIVEPAELAEWHALGLRGVFLTHFGQGRYAAGNPMWWNPDNTHDVDGPVTPLGVELLTEMGKIGMPLDLTHTSDTTFWDALERYGGPVCSSHMNCRAITGQQRELSDDMVRAVTKRGGVVGVVLAVNMIRPDLTEGPIWPPTRHEVTLEHLADHVDHLCQLAGDTDHVAIGSDTDGGFGAECCPHGYDTHRDLHRFGDVLRDRGYGDDAAAAIFHGNWLRFYGGCLPG
ncbi:MAG: membrane dipeptidase [Planctomycetota bacterium]